MAYFVRRHGKSADRIEIRESRATPRGPRSRVLASFCGELTPAVIQQAAGRATRPIQAEALRRSAHAKGIPVTERSREPELRALLARLRRPDALDPVLAGLLREALAQTEVSEPREELRDVCEWVGASAAERGSTLRELLDTYGAIAEVRPLALRDRPRQPFPRFSSLGKAS